MQDDKVWLWNTLEPTNPKYTKPFKGAGGFAGTAINGTYIVKRLTEAFGPCGTGWRFVLDDEKIVEGHTLKSGDKAKLHIVRGHLEYRQAIGVSEPWYATSPQFGQTMLVGENKYGTFTDEEAPKKSITDCVSKCAVLLGIAADVHLGMFDDNKYVNQRTQEVMAEAKANGDGKPHEAPKPEPQKTPLVAKVEPPSTDDKEFARQTFYAVRDQVENAESNQHIDEILKANAKGLKVLETVSPKNYLTIKNSVIERRETLAQGEPADA